MDRDKTVSQISFLLDETRRYRALRGPGALMVGLTMGAMLYVGFDAPIWATVGIGFISAFIVQGMAESSLSVFRVEYARMVHDFPEETNEAIKENPEPTSFFARLRYLIFQ